MKLKANVALMGFLMIEGAFGSSVGTGTAVSRRPVVIDKPTPSPTSIQKKPTTEIHTTIEEEPISEDHELPSPTTVKHEELDQHAEPKTTTTSDPQVSIDPSADPTDYSTVWPTRWRPRRRMNFGAQGDAGKPRAAPDSLLITVVIIGAFISGILL